MAYKKTWSQRYPKQYKKAFKRKIPRKLRAPLPMSLTNKHIYSDQFTLTSTAGTTSGYVFSCNGLYDPNITGTGHQPRGFDEISALYDHYIVSHAKITLWYSTTNAGSDQLLSIGIRDSTSTPTALNNVMELTNTRTALASYYSPRFKLTHSVNPKKFLGYKTSAVDDVLKGSASANPDEQCFFHINGTPIDLASSTTMKIQVLLEYTVRWIEPKQPNSS
jgi:hypothetical protein